MAQKQSLATKLERGLSTQDIPLFLEVACQLINESQDAQKAATGWTCLLLFKEGAIFNAWVEFNKGKCYTGTGKLLNKPTNVIEFKENAAVGILSGKAKVTGESIKASGNVPDLDRFTSLIRTILPALKDLRAPIPVPTTPTPPKGESKPAKKNEPVPKVEAKPAATKVIPEAKPAPPVEKQPVAAVEVKTAPVPVKRPEKAAVKPSAKPAPAAPPAEVPEEKQGAEAPEQPIAKPAAKPAKKAAKKGAKKAAKKPPA